MGYGLEGLLTDATSGLIIRNVITPHFRNGDYGTGIVEGIRNMVGVATEDAQLVSSNMEEEGGLDGQSLVVSIIFFALYFAVLSMAISKAVKTKGRSSSRSTVRMPPPTFTSGSSFSSGSFSSRSSFGGGGFSGGGFSGGGGSFGGGGASGKW